MARIRVNGKRHNVDAEDGTPLLWVLREQLQLTGTKYACGINECGACTVHIDGLPVRSCMYPVEAVSDDAEITTIEGLSENGDHPVQQVWKELDVPQCGYCQPGMIMAVAGLLNSTQDPTDEDIDAEITNICRCGTFVRVREGIHKAAKLIKGA